MLIHSRIYSAYNPKVFVDGYNNLGKKDRKKCNKSVTLLQQIKVQGCSILSSKLSFLESSPLILNIHVVTFTQSLDIDTTPLKCYHSWSSLLLLVVVIVVVVEIVV